METRIAVVGIIVEKLEMTDKLNAILHEYAEYMVGRIGIPYREKNLFIISIVLDAPNDAISSLAGKLGMIDGISVKTVYQKVQAKGE